MKKTLLIILAAGMLAISPASAAITLVTSSAALGGNDLIDWASLGSSFTIVSNPTLSATVNSLGYAVSQAGGNFERRDQNNGWNGNFGAGATLLWTVYPGGGPITLAFASDVYGVGAQIQADFFGAFVARMTAYDSLSNPLGSYTLNGNSTTAGDNSAIYIGLLSTNQDIRAVVFSLDSAASYPNDFAIGNVDVKTASLVPEPGTISLFGGALAVVGLSLARRKKA